MLLVGIFGVAPVASAQGAGDCNHCVPCEEGIRTFLDGVGGWDIAYLDQPTCLYYPEGCENLIQCDDLPDDDPVQEQLLELADLADWTAFIEQAPNAADGLELVPDRRLIIFRDGCSNQAVAIRQIPAVAIQALRERLVATID